MNIKEEDTNNLETSCINLNKKVKLIKEKSSDSIRKDISEDNKNKKRNLKKIWQIKLQIQLKKSNEIIEEEDKIDYEDDLMNESNLYHKFYILSQSKSI